MQGSRQQLYAVLIVAIFSICAAVQLHDVARIIPFRWSDLYSPWKASQSAIRHENPYSAEVTEQIQLGHYGYVLRPNDIWDRQKFVYPAHMVLFMAPFTFLPWLVVRFAFVVAAPIVVGGALWIWMNLAGLDISPARRILLWGLIVTSWPAMWAYRLQQPSIFVFGAISLAVLYFSRKRDVLAGALLALATVKPNLVVLIGVWLVVFAAFNGRWKFIGSFAASLGTLVALAELLIPGWIREWAHAATGYAHEPLRLSLLGHVFGSRIGLVVTVVLVAAAGARLSYTKPGLLASAALLLSVTVCIIPTTKWMIYNNLLLIPAALMLIVTAPSTKLKQLLQFLARAALGWLACAAPITVLLALLIRKPLTILPFLEFNAVLCITVCTLALADRSTATCSASQPIRPRSAATITSARNALP